MNSDNSKHLSEVEEELKGRFRKEEADKRRLPSTAAAAAPSERIDQLVLPDEMRARMPFTKDKYLIKENPHLVTWEREVRKINTVLEFYFGKPYMTWIMGRKVPKAYRVKPGYYIKYHRPLTLTLYAEYVEGVLNP